MQINNTITTYTTSLFQSSGVNDPAGQPSAASDQASVYSAGTGIDMTGFYTDPRVTSVSPATLSQQTQDVLDTIHSLGNNELKAITAKFREMATEELGLQPNEALPENITLSDLETEQRQALSGETRDVGQMQKRLDFFAFLATQTAENLSTSRAIVFGEQYMNMSEEELVDDQINKMVDRQMNAIKTTMDMARSQAFQDASAGVEERTELGAPMEEAELEAMRADLLAKRRDEFERGELRIRVEVFSSAHAANYGKVYATLDTDSGDGRVVQEENRVAFDENWEMPESAKKEHFARKFEGITVVDGQPVLDPGKKNAASHSGMEFLKKFGAIGLEYMRDARA